VQRDASICIVSRAEYHAMPWRNGRGTTHEIVREPANGESFIWRLSLADVPASGPFSAFPGYERIVVLVSGDGFTLDFGEHGRAELTPAQRVARFAGDWQTNCTLRGAPCSDLSWMVRRADALASVRLFELAAEGAHEFDRDAMGAFFCIQGAVGLFAGGCEFALAEWDTALIAPRGERRWLLKPRGRASIVACLSALPRVQDASGASGTTS
jgi:environmental stress-induced protein Ves